MNYRSVLACLVLFVAAPAQAQSADAACSASFSERLADARQAITAQRAYMAEYDRVMPWFEAHCRVLEEVEIVARRLDDPMSFVCDTRRGRPAGLTTRFIAEHSLPLDVPTFQRRSPENTQCREADARDRVSLALHNAGPVEILEVMCFGVETEQCESVRARIAAARARAAEGAPPPTVAE